MASHPDIQGSSALLFNRGTLLLTWSRLEIGPDDIMATAKSKLVSEDDKAAMLHPFFAM